MPPLRHLAPLVLLTTLAACGSLRPTGPGASEPGAVAEAAPHPLGWLAGHWVGEGFGGEVEEGWFPPKGGTLLGLFRLFADGKPGFYEIMTLEADTERDGDFWLHIKHFDPDLRSWEAQDARRSFASEWLGPKHVKFGPVEYESLGPDELRISVRTSNAQEPTELRLRRFVRG